MVFFLYFLLAFFVYLSCLECYEIWLGCIQSIIDKIRPGEDTEMLQCAIDVSADQELQSKPWTLRMALETFSWLHFGSKSSFDIHSATSNGFIEQVTILSKISGLVNQKKV